MISGLIISFGPANLLLALKEHGPIGVVLFFYINMVVNDIMFWGPILDTVGKDMGTIAY